MHAVVKCIFKIRYQQLKLNLLSVGYLLCSHRTLSKTYKGSSESFGKLILLLRPNRFLMVLPIKSIKSITS